MRYYSIKILTATDGAEARDLRGHQRRWGCV